MSDLKSQLLKKGLVTKEQVDKVEAQKKAQHNRQKKNTTPKSDIDYQAFDRKKALDHLLAQPKAEQYVIIRRWVERNRLDKASDISLDCEKYFITGSDQQITWLTLKKEVIEQISTGKAGVIAYMSNHGLTHAVVPREIAQDVGKAFKDWLKVLERPSDSET